MLPSALTASPLLGTPPWFSVFAHRNRTPGGGDRVEELRDAVSHAQGGPLVAEERSRRRTARVEPPALAAQALKSPAQQLAGRGAGTVPARRLISAASNSKI
jgi:hypothetical protein